jgi:hypothetical protein
MKDPEEDVCGLAIEPISMRGDVELVNGSCRPAKRKMVVGQSSARRVSLIHVGSLSTPRERRRWQPMCWVGATQNARFAMAGHIPSHPDVDVELEHAQLLQGEMHGNMTGKKLIMYVTSRHHPCHMPILTKV